MIDDPGLPVAVDARHRPPAGPATVTISDDRSTRLAPSPADGGATLPSTFERRSASSPPSPSRPARRRRRARPDPLLVPLGAPRPGHRQRERRSVEWMREHHLGGIVNSAERNWYNHHQAKVGGTPNVATATPQLASPTGAAPTGSGSASGAPASRSQHSATTESPGAPVASPRALPPPPALTSPAPIPVPGEGRWSAIDHASAGQPGAYATVIRPDAVHTSVLDAVVWLDPHLVRCANTRVRGSRCTLGPAGPHPDGGSAELDRRLQRRLPAGRLPWRADPRPPTRSRRCVTAPPP